MSDSTKVLSAPRTGNLIKAGSNVFKAAVCVFLVLLLYANLYWAFRDYDLRDFGSFVASGRAAVAGRNPYSETEPLVFHVWYEKLGIDSKAPNLNPPVTVMVFELLAPYEPGVAFFFWRVISVALYAVALILLFRRYPAKRNLLFIGWAVNLVGFWFTVELGQIYILLLLLGVAAWILLSREKPSELAAGLLIGLIVAVKPNFAIWPVFLFLIGLRRTALTAFLIAAFISVLPVFVYGPGIYWQWLEASQLFHGLAFPGNNSLTGLFTRFSLAAVGTAAGFLLALVTMGMVWKKKPSIQDTSALGLVVSLLASPIAWTGYTLLLLPVFFDRKWNPYILTAALFFIVPFEGVTILFQESTAAFIVVGWFYGWALLVLFAHLLGRSLHILNRGGVSFDRR